jgi:hypothetical protein
MPTPYYKQWLERNPDYFSSYYKKNCKKMDNYHKDYVAKNEESLKEYYKTWKSKRDDKTNEPKMGRTRVRQLRIERELKELKKKSEAFKASLSEATVSLSEANNIL